jgi:hypothetical protein
MALFIAFCGEMKAVLSGFLVFFLLLWLRLLDTLQEDGRKYSSWKYCVISVETCLASKL